MFRVRFVVLVVVAVVAAIAAAEESTFPTAPRAIDVIVTDNRGNRVANLAESDFQIYEDGQTRSIAKFAALTNTGQEAFDAQPRRSIVVIIDEVSISLPARRTIVAALRSFVDTRVRPIDRMMIVTIAGIGGVFPATSWTSNKEDLLKALDKAESASIGNKSFERMEAERNITMTIAYARQAEADQPGTQIPMTFDTLMQSGRQYAGIMQQEARATVSAINDALSFLGSGPGKKVAIIAGGGLSTRPGADMFQYLEDLRQQALLGNLGTSLSRGAATANPYSEGSRFEITDVVRDVSRSAHDRGIIVYTLDPDTTGNSISSVERTTATNNTEEFIGVADRLSGYQLLSNLTGGLTLTSRGPITEIASDLDTHYVLGYQQSLTAKGTLPKVDVKVTKPGYRVRSAFTGGPETKEAAIQDTVIANQASGAV